MWRTVKLGDICTIVNGGTPKSNVKDYWDGNIKWLTPKDMGKLQDRYVRNTERQITADGLANSSAKLVPKNSIILSCRAPIGHVFINDCEMSFNQGCKGLIPSNDLLVEYLYYFLFASKKLLNDLGTGTTFKEISGKTLSNVTISLPPLAEQQRIVAKLDAAFAEIDKAIEKASARLSEHQNITEAYLEKHFERELTGTDVKRMDEGLEKITYGFTNPMPTSESGKYLITAKNVLGGTIDYDNARFTTVEAFENELTEKSKPKIGDVLLTKDGTLGRLAVVDREEICVNQSVAVLRTNSRLNPHYLKWQLSSPLFQRRMKSEAGGTTIKHIYITRVDKMDICMPLIELQLEFVDKAECLDQKVRELIELRKKQLANLNALKSAILEQELQPSEAA